MMESPRMRVQPSPGRGTNAPASPPSEVGSVTAGRPSQSMNLGIVRSRGVLRTMSSVGPEERSVQGEHCEKPAEYAARRIVDETESFDSGVEQECEEGGEVQRQE